MTRVIQNWPGIGRAPDQSLEDYIGQVHLQMPDRLDQVDFAGTIALAKKSAPVVCDFEEHVLERFRGRKMVHIGGACRLPYLVGRKLAPNHGIPRDDIILLDLPEKVLMEALQREGGENLVVDYLAGRNVTPEDARGYVFLDSGMEGSIPSLLSSFVGAGRSEKFLLYSSSEVDGYNKLFPGVEGGNRERRDMIHRAAVFLDSAARSTGIGYLVRDDRGVHPRYKPADRIQYEEEYMPNDNGYSHKHDRRLAWFVAQIMLEEARKRIR
ncbi:MAG: hypothetical protein GF416_05080 [Candidatus Altiarchaeales archaeon]|nr:hypothetical protein [Candidatus Altiarchaeales archaeon]MBD3416489.1 hypothetical protein [Candidatus Altiarchaeales archaeon]